MKQETGPNLVKGYGFDEKTERLFDGIIGGGIDKGAKGVVFVACKIVEERALIGKIAYGAGLSVLVAAASLTAACAPEQNATSTPTLTPLVIAGTDIGNGYFLNNAEGLSAITSIKFSEDKAYAGDSIKMDVGFTGDEYYTVVSQDSNPNVGTLVADPHLVAAGQSETTHP